MRPYSSIEGTGEDTLWPAYDVIVFGSPRSRYGVYHNFTPRSVRVGPLTFQSSEALYQALRFTDPDFQRQLAECDSAWAAKSLAYTRIHDTIMDWERVKGDAMTWVVWVRAMQQPGLRASLRQHSNKLIIESSLRDRYWGAVREGLGGRRLRGRNELGRTLMAVGDALDAGDPIRFVSPPGSPFRLLGQPLPVIPYER